MHSEALASVKIMILFLTILTNKHNKTQTSDPGKTRLPKCANVTILSLPGVLKVHKVTLSPSWEKR